MVKDPIVDSLFMFLSNDEHLKDAQAWLESNKITVGDATLYELKDTHRKSILKALFKSDKLTLATKNEILENVLGDDKSDLAERCRIACHAQLPDAEVKAKMWADIIDANSADSSYVKQAKMSGFGIRSQQSILEPYDAKFYEVLPHVFKTMNHRNFSIFFMHMLPRNGDIKDEHIVKLVCLK